MKNVLKPETPPIIQQLYKAKIRVVMVTGDNILTAACVARECGMVLPADKIINITLDNAEGLQFSLLGEMEGNMNIDSSYMADFENPSFLKRSYHFAVTGKVYNVIQSKYPMLYVKLLVCGTIFSRMLPDQKTSLIEGLQSLGYGVGMCGDGANDCGALKRAHTGISLSDSEASIASPFTSKIPNISCVINVIKEGRCALVTSFNIFKYMALYSMIQYSSVLILYSISSNLGDFQYLYIDLFTITPFAVTMSRTGPANAFVAKRPLGRLMHPFVLFSVVLQIVIQMVFQIAVFYYVRMLPNYKPIEDFRSKSWYPGESQIVCYENTMLFNFTSFQYIIVALVFSVGRPYRQPFYRNILFLISGIVLSTITCLFTIQPNKYFMKYLELLSIDDKYYYIVFFGLLFFNLLLSYMVDHVFLDISCIQKCLKWMLRKKGPRNRYKVILNEIDNDPSWPPSTSYEHKVIC